MKKHDYDKILYRLTNIWQRLREGEILSVKELAEEYNVSTKTIQRDFNERLIHKLPIEKIGHKWKVIDGHNIDKNLTFEEDLVLDVLKELANSMGNSFGSKAGNLFSKLQNSHENPIFSKIEIEDISDKTDIIQQLQNAIINHQEITYNFKNKQRLVQPYKITTFEGFWYLYGYEVNSQKLKTFYIKDIDSLQITEKKFIPQAKAITILQNALNIWFEPNSQPFEVRLVAKAPIAKYFERRPLNSNQLITNRYKDGSIELLISASCNIEVIYELKKWLPFLLVIEPQSVANEMLKITKDFLEDQQQYVH